MSLPEIPPGDRKHLEEMGEPYVRFLVRAGNPVPYGTVWLAELDEKYSKRSELLAKIAAYGSIGAVFVGIIGIIVMFALWDHPRR
jgi:hypothetical protein